MPEHNLQGAIQKLEAVVADLNKKGDVQEGLKKFKEGVELIKFCKSELQTAENEFKRLKLELDKFEDEHHEAMPQKDDGDLKPEDLPY